MYHSDYSSVTEKSFVGFVGIEIYCRHCEETFSFKTKLYKHLRVGCVGKSKQVNSGEVLQDPEFEPTSSTSLQIIKSDSSTKDLGMGFGFRN